jgi:hypothetical protein
LSPIWRSADLDYEIEQWNKTAHSLSGFVFRKYGDGSARSGPVGHVGVQQPASLHDQWSGVDRRIQSGWHMGRAGEPSVSSTNRHHGNVDATGVTATNAGRIGPGGSFYRNRKQISGHGGISCVKRIGHRSQNLALWVRPSNFSARRNPINKAYGGEGTLTIETSGSG